MTLSGMMQLRDDLLPIEKQLQAVKHFADTAPDVAGGADQQLADKEAPRDESGMQR